MLRSTRPRRRDRYPDPSLMALYALVPRAFVILPVILIVFVIKSISLGGRAGLLWGFSSPTLFSDRFQLGGPASVRSFKANSLGPRDGGALQNLLLRVHSHHLMVLVR